ncbi:MAG: PIG-L deacetylase family protein [Alphaproteobacteria bacterium]
MNGVTLNTTERRPLARRRRFGILAAAAILLVATRGASAESVLYVFAHEDDELFALARMRQDVNAGRAVYAIWTTNGAFEGKPGEREEESRAVMALVGVPEANLRFLGFPDHDSCRYLPEIYDDVRKLRKSWNVTRIISPAYEGGNIDHDAAAFIAAMVVRNATVPLTHFEFPLYNHFEGRQRVNVFLPNSDAPVEYLPLDGDAGQIVHAALKRYRSQHFILMLLEVTGHAKTLFERGEPFRRAATYDFTERPERELCGYEISGRHRASFAEWTTAVEEFLVSRRASGIAADALRIPERPAPAVRR